MQTNSLKRATFNINGVLNPVKRGKILSKLKKDKIQVAFLQETHLNDSEHAKLNRSGFKHVFFSSYGSGRRRGVATLISGAVNFEYISEHKDKDGRFVMVTGRIGGFLASLLNVYVPPGSDWSLYKHIVDLMITKSQGILLCGGDFNIRLNPKLDSSNGKSVTRSINRRLNTYLHKVGIVDVWRELNPTSQDYSHYSSTHNVYSRIDYFFMLKGDFFRVNDCKIGPNTISDHGPIYMLVHLNINRESTLWRLNAKHFE